MINYKSLDDRWSDKNAFNSYYDCISVSLKFLDDDLLRVWSQVSNEAISKSRVRSYKRPENNSNFQFLSEKQLTLFLCAVIKDLGLIYGDMEIESLVNILYLEYCQNSEISVEEKLLAIRMTRRGF